MQTQEKKTIYLLRLRPQVDVEKKLITVETELVSTDVDYSQDDNSVLDFYYKHTECDCIDIVSFGGLYNPKGFSVVCDDEGLLKSGNAVMKYTLPIDNVPYELDLSGSILIGKSDTIKGRELDGLFEVGLTMDEIEYIQDNLHIEFLGLTH